ncbi:Invasion protein iagA [Pseudomonas synxantha]|nr:Invasion protein iagA [Pseudomonas synxantha]
MTDMVNPSFTEDVAFGKWVWRKNGGLWLGSECVHLPPKESRLLELLLASEGRELSKDRLLDSIWPHQAVGDESLSRCIYILRKILRSSDSKSYIATIYGKGYRFVRPVISIPETTHSITVAPSVKLTPNVASLGCSDFAHAPSIVTALLCDTQMLDELGGLQSGRRMCLELVNQCGTLTLHRLHPSAPEPIERFTSGASRSAA